jgi:branched-chain amino acid transport system permease protein
MLRSGLQVPHVDIRRQWAALCQWPASDLAPLVIFLLLALVPAFASLGAEIYLLSLFTRVMIFAIAALALDLIVGYGALVSFGHAAFVGLGAYAVGILAFHGMSEILLSLPLAICVAALFAVATGFVCLRTKGVYFIMITLAFGQMAFFTASSLAPYGGDDGLTIRARDTLLGFRVLSSDRALYYVVLLCLLGSFLLCRAIVLSRFGRVLRGARENSMRVAAIGFEVFRYQLIAYVISGALAGLSGFLLANAAEFVSPAYMSWQRSGELIIMVLFGGMGTLYGPIIGTAAFLLTEEWLSGLTEHWKAIFGPLLVLVVVFARGGLVGLALQVVRTLRDDPLGRGFALAARLHADIVRRVLLGAQQARHAFAGIGAQLAPVIQTTTSRIAMLPVRVHTGTKRVAARLVPVQHASHEAVARGSALATRLREDIVRRLLLGAQHARSGLARMGAQLAPVIQPAIAAIVALPPRVHTRTERLAVRLVPILHASREAVARGSAFATELREDIVRRLLLGAQHARAGLARTGAQLAPVIQATTARIGPLAPRIHKSAARLAVRLMPAVHASREAVARGSAFATKLREDIARRLLLGAQKARHGLVKIVAQLEPMIQPTTAQIAALAWRVHASIERLAAGWALAQQAYREAVGRLARRLTGEVAGLRSQLTRRLRGG